MGRQSHTKHNRIDQSCVLISSHQTTPTGRFQAEVTLGPGKMTFNNGPWSHMKMPLVQKKQRNQKPFAAPPQIVINHEGCLQGEANKGHDRGGEVAGIGTHNRDGQTKQRHTQCQQGNRGNGFLPVSGCNQEKNGQLLFFEM